MAEQYVWGSAPKTYFTVTDTVKREQYGKSDKYSGTITVSLDEMSGTHYFGYNIYCSVNGGTAQILKDNSPSQWSGGVYKKSFSVSGTTSASLVSFKIKLYSTNAPRDAATYTYNVTIGAKTQIPPPSVSDGWFSVARDNSGTPASGITEWVCGYSKAKVTFDPSKVTVDSTATISSFSVTYDGFQTTATDNVATTGVITDKSAKLTLTVTDSLGKSTSDTYTITALPYSNPTLTNVSVYRSDSLMASSDEGNYLTVKGTPGFTSLNGKNSITFTVAYKQSGASSFGDEVGLESDTLTIINSTEVSNTESYVVRLTVTDALGNKAIYEQIVSTKSVAFHLKNGGNGAAFGKFSEADNTLEVLWDLNVIGNISAGNIADMVCEIGTADESGITWTYQKRRSGIAECWGTWSGTLTHYLTTGGFFGFCTPVNFPRGFFNDAPMITYSCSVGSSFAMPGPSLSTNAHSTNVYALTPVSGEQSCKFNIRAIGRWK